MKHLRQWFETHSAALSAMAALAFLVSVLIVIPLYVLNAFSSDIIIRVARTTFTLSNEFEKSVEMLNDAARRLSYTLEEESKHRNDIKTLLPDVIETLGQIQDQELSSALFGIDESIYQLRSLTRQLESSIEAQNRRRITDHAETVLATLSSKAIRKLLEYYHRDLGKISIRLINNTNNVISGVRLRLEGLSRLWDIEASGTFSTQTEISAMVEELKRAYAKGALVFPEIQAMPANGALVFEVYVFDNPEFLDLKISAAGYSYVVRELIEVDETWLIRLLHEPYKFLPLLLAMLPLLVLLLAVAWAAIRRRIAKKETKNVLYNAACAEAGAGRLDDAIALLRQAIEHGYSDGEHMAQDEDLQPLRARPDYQSLLEELKRTG